MKFWDLVRIANRNLFRSKLRTLLTIMAIFVGSFTLIMTNGLGDGLRDYVETQVKDLEGNNILFVRKSPKNADTEAKPGEPAEYKEKTESDSGSVIDPNSFSISTDEMEALKREITDIKSVTPRYSARGEYVTIDGSKKYQVLLGTLSEGLVQKTEAGRTIDGSGQILLPLPLAKALNPDIDSLIGKSVTIGYKVGQRGEMRTTPLTITGVSTKGLITNIFTYIDVQTAKRIYEEQNGQADGYNKFGSVTVQLRTGDERTIESIKKKLVAKGFAAETVADQKKRTYDAIGILQIGLNFFAFIALLAASFGIINTLVIAVMERTKEIGLQKALGMSRGRVFLLFSLESVLIGFWGAALGIAGGIVVGTIANIVLARTYLESFEGYNLFSFKPLSIIFVIVLVCIIAFLAGVLPAFRASRLDPIEALRYE